MKRNVPKYDYGAQFAEFLPEALDEIGQLLVSGDYVLGPAVGRFEDELARFLGVGHTVGLNSGTDALVLAMDALGIGSGDEVITVANTFHATAMAIRRRGATPVFVDCRDDDFLIDLDQVAAAITPRTRAVIVVHMFGLAVDVPRARALCEANGLVLVEDCAQAIGARFGGQRVGTASAVGCWSFAPSKNLAAAGDGGAVSTPDADLAARIRLLRHFGQPSQNEHEVLGYNSRLDTIQAIVLRHKLRRLDAWNERRRTVVRRYDERLAGLPVRYQACDDPLRHVHHLHQVRLPDERTRDGVLDALRRNGVDAVVRYPVPLHLQPALRSPEHRAGKYPVSEALARDTLCLPVHPDLTSAEIDHVSDVIHAYFGRRAEPATTAPVGAQTAMGERA